VTLDEAKKAVGVNGCTSTKKLQKGLKALGIKAGRGKLKPIYGDLTKLPHTGILKVVSEGRRSGWHWVLKVGGKIYCPSRGYYPVKKYETKTDCKITSYLEVKNEKN
jgi:hypothetical protein